MWVNSRTRRHRRITRIRVLEFRSARSASIQLKQLNAELRRAIVSFPLERLDEPLVPEPPYAAYTLFIGVTQHGLSHAGQMALLKKALGPVDPAPPQPS